MLRFLLILPNRIFPFLICAVLLSSCYYDNLEELHPNGSGANCDTSGTMSYSNDILPILNSSCGINNSCHNASSGRYRMDTYSATATVATNGLLLKAVTHDPSVTPMPYNAGSLDHCSIIKIKNWIDQGFPEN